MTHSAVNVQTNEGDSMKREFRLALEPRHALGAAGERPKNLAEVQKHKRPSTYDACSHAIKLFRQGCEVERSRANLGDEFQAGV